MSRRRLLVDLDDRGLSSSDGERMWDDPSRVRRARDVAGEKLRIVDGRAFSSSLEDAPTMDWSLGPMRASSPRQVAGGQSRRPLDDSQLHAVRLRPSPPAVGRILCTFSMTPASFLTVLECRLGAAM